MAKGPELYKCDKCGKVIMVTSPGEGTLVCCDEKMRLLEEQTVAIRTDENAALVGKHVPVVEKSDKGIKVSIGSITHPMVDVHHIEWVAVADGDLIMIKKLRAGEEPVAEFPTANTGVDAYDYCNVHEFWSNRK